MKRVTSFGNDTVDTSLNSYAVDDYLNIEELVIGSSYKKIGLVMGLKTGQDRYSQNYIILNVKDCNANVIQCALFRVKEINDVSIFVRSIINKPVQLEFTVTEYKGSLSLLIDDYAGFTQVEERLIEREKFVGQVPVDVEQLQGMADYLGIDTSCISRFTGVSFPELYGGKVNGFLKLYEIVLTSCLSLRDASLVNCDWLAKVAHITLIELFNWYNDNNRSPIEAREKAFTKIANINRVYPYEEIAPYVRDSVSCRLIDSKCVTVYGILVNRFIDRALEDSRLMQAYGTLALGMSTVLQGGVELLKYSK